MNRFQTRMSWMAMLGLLAVLVVSATAVQASGARWTLTESKARQMVTRKATVQVPSPLKASLASELQAAVRLYGGLQMAAIDVGDAKALASYQSVGARYRRALEKVQAACRSARQPARAWASPSEPTGSRAFAAW